MTIQEMARMGGKASANKRLGGKTQSEISSIMKLVRKAALTNSESKEFNKSVDGMVKNLNNNVKSEKLYC